MRFFDYNERRIPDVAIVFAAVNRKQVSAQTSRTGYYRGLSESMARAQQQILLAHHSGIPKLIVVVSHMEDAEPPFGNQMFDAFKKKVVDWMREKVPRFSDAIFLPTADSDARHMEEQVICSNPNRRHDHDVDCSHRGVRSHFDNMYAKTAKMPWDKNGPTFMQALQGTSRVPAGLDKKPLRLLVEDSYRIQGVGTVPVGSVVYGTMKNGMMVKFCPTGITVEVKSISKGHHDLIEEAVPFDEVGFNVKGVAATDLKRGYIASQPGSSYHGQALSFTAVVTINGGRVPKKYQYKMFLVEVGTQRILCQFHEFIAKVDSTTGERLPESLEPLKYGESGLVKFVPWEPMCVETFSEFPALGRFTMLEDFGQRIYGVGFGIIESVEFADTFTPVNPYSVKKKKKTSGATLLALGSSNATRTSHTGTLSTESVSSAQNPE